MSRPCRCLRFRHFSAAGSHRTSQRHSPPGRGPLPLQHSRMRSLARDVVAGWCGELPAEAPAQAGRFGAVHDIQVAPEPSRSSTKTIRFEGAHPTFPPRVAGFARRAAQLRRWRAIPASLRCVTVDARSPAPARRRASVLSVLLRTPSSPSRPTVGARVRLDRCGACWPSR